VLAEAQTAPKGCDPDRKAAPLGCVQAVTIHAMDIIRLHLAQINVIAEPWPVHGFVVLHPALGPVLVDSGCGAPQELMREYKVVNREVADALAEHDLSPADIKVVVNTHLHFDHCGQNAVFPHAPIYVQRKELERARQEDPWQRDWLEYAGARYELLDGDTELGEGLRLLATPGHTVGHQSVAVDQAGGEHDLLIGDAAFTSEIYHHPEMEELPDAQETDRAAWAASLERIRRMQPSRVHFCHDTGLVVS
jgi:N-acyl homoserine lactone hydrolase